MILHKTDFGFAFFCPGCKCGHGVWLNYPNPTTGAKWTWNGSLDKPSFQRSLLMDKTKPRCHVVITDGILCYEKDCEHQYADQKIPMVDF